MEYTEMTTDKTSGPTYLVDRAKELLEWNRRKLTSSSNLKIEDIGQLFAEKFVVLANGREYQANFHNYFEFLNKFRSDIDTIDYHVHDYYPSKSAVIMPLTAAIKRTNGTTDTFEAFLLLKFNPSGKIILWQEVYIQR